MKEYHVTKDMPDAKSQLESMIGQIVDAALTKATAFKASIIPGKGTLTLTVSMDLPERTAEQRKTVIYPPPPAAPPAAEPKS